MKCVYLILSCLFIPSLVFSQGNAIDAGGGQINVRMYKTDEVYEPDYLGTPYLFEDFTEGYFSNYQRNYPVRYNIHADELEVKNNAGIFVLASELQNISISLEQKNIVLQRINIPGLSKRYAVLLWDDSKGRSLLKVYDKNYIPSTSSNGYQKATNAKFSATKESLYLYDKDQNALVEVPNSKSRIFKLLFNKELKNYAKKNDLDASNEADLLVLLNEYYK